MCHSLNAIRFSFSMRRTLPALVFLYFTILSKCIVYAQSPETHLKWMQFVKNDFSNHFDAVLDAKTQLLHFKESVPFQQLSSAGFTVFRRLESNVVIGQFADNSKRLMLRNYNSYTTNSLWKLSERLLSTYASSNNLSGTYWVKMKKGNGLLRYLENAEDISILIKRGEYLLIEIQGLPLHELIDMDELLYIGKESSNVKNEANVLDLNHHPNRINAVHHLFPDLRGAEQMLSIKEPFYDISDIDLAGRYIPSGLESDFVDPHATQMATISLGAGNSFITGRGVAPMAQHSSSSNAMVVPDNATDYESLDIQVQNHSYGTEIEPFYGAMAALFDESTIDNPNLLHIFSSGNSGNETSDEGVYAGIEGFASLTGNFKQAKNILTVGSVDTTHTPIGLASKGPAYDGRVKPELVTYSMAGTSNSAALVSGTTLLLQERFKENTVSGMPAALLKGMLINSADDVFNKGVDYTTGFGNLNALRAIENLNNQQHFSGTVQQGDAKAFNLEIPINAVNLKVTLIWTDPPANANDAVALVNDLDLRVISPATDTFLPMVLNTDPSSINNPAIPGVDRLNNVEQVVIDTPEAGSFTIEVEGYNIPEGEQTFYVAYQWDIANQFRFTSPTGSDNIPYNGTTTSHLRWESSYGASLGRLSYKIVVGEGTSEWIPIGSGLTLENEQYRWKAPDIFNLAVLKMEIEGTEYLSDTFSISAPLRLNVGFNCSDSISLEWREVPNATFYEVQSIINNEMQPISTTANNNLVLAKNDFESNYFKIRPYINDQTMMESFTIDYELQGAGCYLNTFFVEAVQDSGVFTSIGLGALSGLKEIKFQKLSPVNNWETFTIKQANQFNYRVLDPNPNDGFNTYRVQLIFENNTSITSDIGSTYYVYSQDFIVYPNPVKSNETLFVFSKLLEGLYQFKLYNLAGELVYISEITDTRSFIEIPTLPDGVYMYIIDQNNAIKAKSKLVIGS